MKKYFINPLAVLFHPGIDARNDYRTIVYNWKTQNILKVNRFGYEVLKVLNERSRLSLDELCRLVSQRRKTAEWQIKSKIVKFIEQMVEENIINEKS